MSKSTLTNKTVCDNTNNSQNAIVVQNLTKRFGKNFIAVDNANFIVKKGTIHGFIGPNGAGKTTTIKCLISAMIITEGKALINNLPAGSLEAKKYIGYIPENARFPKGISTYNFLVSMSTLTGLSKEESKQRVEKELKEQGLWDFKDKSPNTFSSGMKKKVLLIQALVDNPEIIIMDEPSANLDPTSRTEMFEAFKQLKQNGKTIFISSHILPELQEIVDEITVLNKGKVVYSGSMKMDSKPKYQIKSNNNELLKKLIKDHHFKFNEKDDLLILDLDNEKQIKEIYQLAIKNDILISEFHLQTINLQQLYQDKVMGK